MHSSILYQEDTVMKNNVSIEFFVNEILTLLKDSESGYSRKSIHEYELSFKIIQSHLKSQGILMYEKEAVSSSCRNLCTYGSLSKTRSNHVSITVKNLEYYSEHRRLQPKNGSHSKIECINCGYENIVNEYLEHCHQILSIKKETLRIKRVYDIHFLNYLTMKQVPLAMISGDTIASYLFSIDKERKWSARTKNTNLYELRQFLTYLADKYRVSNNAITPLSIVFGCHESCLPAYYEASEIARLINNIDISSPKGKRDYLVCLLFTQLGMRAGDVSRLTFTDIHWDRNTIELVQQKTGNPLVLPLLESLRIALLDYWRNARPESSSDTVLITQSKPHRNLATAYLSSIVTDRLQKAGVEINNRKHGSHAMRHSLARNLLSNNEQLSTITGILGHENSNTTRRYLSIDTKGLRHIALEVPYDC
jgi:site-specific recombinase XerD